MRLLILPLCRLMLLRPLLGLDSTQMKIGLVMFALVGISDGGQLVVVVMMPLLLTTLPRKVNASPMKHLISQRLKEISGRMCMAWIGYVIGAVSGTLRRIRHVP